MLNLFTYLLAVAPGSPTQVAQAESRSRSPGALTWAAFECATWAELSGNSTEQKRLFSIGYGAAVQVVERAKKGTLTDAERKDLPIGILLLLAGPSVDFVVGRIFENVNQYAFDKVVKEDNHGVPIFDPSKWATDEVRTVRARDKFRSSNCALIK